MGYESTVPKLGRIVSGIPRNKELIFQAIKNPFEFFDDVREKPLSADKLYIGFALAKILKHEPTANPLNLQRIVSENNHYYPELGKHDVDFVRAQLHNYFPKDYREEEAELDVYDIENRHALLVVSAGKCRFKTSLPYSYFRKQPKVGDKHTCIVWDLFQHWFGIHKVTYAGSSLSEWTEEQRAEFIESLKKIEFRPKVERNSRKVN